MIDCPEKQKPTGEMPCDLWRLFLRTLGQQRLSERGVFHGWITPEWERVSRHGTPRAGHNRKGRQQSL